MKIFEFLHRGTGPTAAFAALALVALAIGRPVSAAEPLGDLGVSLRLVEKDQGKGPKGPSMTGVARIEVQVEAFRATKDVELRILRPDGSEWEVKGRPLAAGRPSWTGPGGEPQEPGADGQTIPARGAIRTTIVVPLEGTSIHEIVVAVTGLVGGDAISTSAILRVPLGLDDNQPVDDGTHANFSMKGVE